MNCARNLAPEQLDRRTGEIYTELLGNGSKISDFLRTHSLRPAAMLSHLALYMDILFEPGGLSRQQREMIAVVVSRENSCEHCVAHHLQTLSDLVSDPRLLETIAKDYRKLDLPAADRALLDYAVKLTHHPHSAGAGEIDRLRELGFPEEDILLARLMTSYFNLINRIARELSATPEPG